MINKMLSNVIISMALLLNSYVECQPIAKSLQSPNPSSKTINRSYSVTANSDISHLLVNAVKPGDRPTIVAIPLYLRNNLSKYPSIFEILTSMQNDSKSKDVFSSPSNGSSKNTQSDLNYNSSLVTQKYSTQPLKPVKYGIKEEHKVLRPQQQSTPKEQNYDSEYNDPNEPKIQVQWSSTSGANRYSDSDDKITLLRSPVQRYPTNERREPQTDYESGLSANNKFNDMSHNEQKLTNLDYEQNERPLRTNGQLSVRNYLKPYTNPSDNAMAKSKSDVQTDNIQPQGSYSLDDSAVAMDQQYVNVRNHNDNTYQSVRDNNKKDVNDYQFKSSIASIPSSIRYSPFLPVQPSDRNLYTIPSNSYGYKPNGHKSNYETSYVSPYLQTSPAMSPQSAPDDHSHQPSANPNLQSFANYNSRLLTPSTSPDSQRHFNTLDQSSDQTPQSFNLNSQSIPLSQSQYQSPDPKPCLVPNYSSDYSTSDDVECMDDSSGDYKSSHSSHVFRAHNDRPEVDTKTNERDNYETEDWDPTNLDLKIVHLPVSLLRRLIGTGDIGLPTFQQH